MCVDVFNYTCGDQKYSKQIKIGPTGDMLLVPTRSNAISRGLRLEFVLGLELVLGLGDRVSFRVRS